MGGEGEQTPDSDAPRAVGRMLAGRYRIQSIIGEGGMAVVYEGEHVAIGKRVAIKLVHSVLAKDSDVVHRFEHEARSASAVESEHIVHVFDAGADPELGLFLVMELLKGEDLEQSIERRGALDPVFACAVVRQAALGLEKAHAAGVVHRDLKPANVFLVERDDGTTLVKVVDFGIAKIVRDAQDARFSRRGITRSGTAVGTPQYMSPEQAQALDTVDHRTDVYSLGAVLFEAIAGRPHLPERPTYEQTILQIVSTPAPRLSSVAAGIPAALDTLVAEMLEHDVERRVQDMRTVRERLDAIYPELHLSQVKLRSLRPSFVRGVPTAADASADALAIESAIVRPRRRRSLVAVATLAVLMGVALGMAVMWRQRAGAAPEHASVSPPSEPIPRPVVDPPTAALPSPPAHLPALTPPPATSLASPPADAPRSGGARRPSAPGAAGRGPRESPRDPPGGATGQVGAAGISSQF
jgi:serine/threonine protein kinase